MRQPYRIHKVTETSYRVWRVDTPGKSWMVDTLTGLCSCKKTNCQHPELLEEFFNPHGMPRAAAREVAQQFLDSFKADPFLSKIACTGSRKNRAGLITHIDFDLIYRGKGKPTDLEVRSNGVNVRLRFKFQMNQAIKPVALAIAFEEEPGKWEQWF